MLVLTRRYGESITIGEGDDAIRIVVSRLDRGQVRLGVEAKHNIRVLRSELLPKNDKAKE